MSPMSKGSLSKITYEQTFNESLAYFCPFLSSSYPVEEIGKFFEIQNHMTHPGSGHSHSQCPIELEGKKKSYFKISLPWRIKTPPGYSCLFMQPYYHFEKEFALLPAIIDTDVCDLNSVHFPGYLKDPVKSTLSTELLQMISDENK